MLLLIVEATRSTSSFAFGIDHNRNMPLDEKNGAGAAAAGVSASSADHSSLTMQLAQRESAEHMHGMDEVYRSMRNRPLTIKVYALDDPQAPTTKSDGNVKVVHFVRHGQGFHNLMAEVYEEQGRKWVSVSIRKSLTDAT